MSSLHNIPDEIIKLTNQEKCKIIISYESEGDLDMIEFNKFFHKSL